MAAAPSQRESITTSDDKGETEQRGWSSQQQHRVLQHIYATWWPSAKTFARYTFLARFASSSRLLLSSFRFLSSFALSCSPITPPDSSTCSR